MSLKTKLAKAGKKRKAGVVPASAQVLGPRGAAGRALDAVAKRAEKEKTAPPRKPKKPKKPERRKLPRSAEVLSLFRADGSVVPGAEWVIAGQGVAHPVGALDEVLNDVPRTKEGLRGYFTATALRGILFDQGPGKPVGVLREDVGL